MGRSPRTPLWSVRAPRSATELGESNLRGSADDVIRQVVVPGGLGLFHPPGGVTASSLAVALRRRGERSVTLSQNATIR